MFSLWGLCSAAQRAAQEPLTGDHVSVEGMDLLSRDPRCWGARAQRPLGFPPY